MRGQALILVGLVVSTGSLTIAVDGALSRLGARSEDRADAIITRASFGPDGSIDLPVGYRQWSHVGTRYKPDGISILDGLPLRAPEIMNAYVEPSAMAWFQKTGEWPDGSQIVKEMSSIQVGSRCNQTTPICNKFIGDGIFQANYVGLGMMVKDSMRFPDAPGNWGYFSFGHKLPPYNSPAAAAPKEQCQSCHVKLASDTDYVISRAHIKLAGKTDN